MRSAPECCFHRPLADYINGLARCGLLLDAMRELAGPAGRGAARADERAEAEFPLFLALRAVKWGA